MDRPQGGTVIDGPSRAVLFAARAICHPKIIEALHARCSDLTFVSPFARASAVLRPGGRGRSVTPEGPEPRVLVQFGVRAINDQPRSKIIRALLDRQGGRTGRHFVSGKGLSRGEISGRRSACGAGQQTAAPFRSPFAGDRLHAPHLDRGRDQRAGPARGRRRTGRGPAARRFDNFGARPIAACFVRSRWPGPRAPLPPPRGLPCSALREICDANWILLVFDEVITGFSGRRRRAFFARDGLPGRHPRT